MILKTLVKNNIHSSMRPGLVKTMVMVTVYTTVLDYLLENESIIFAITSPDVPLTD